MREALFYQKQEDNKVICELCPHYCKLKDGQTGICNVRKNEGGILYSMVYGRSIAVHVDPIEKKPLFHLAPGSRSFSMATAGCNFQCKFCQNHDISQVTEKINLNMIGQELTPEEIVKMAKRNNCVSIAYTYTEPTIFFEYAYDTAKLAHQQGMLNVFVTNGYINPEPLKYISQYLDAANVDLKSFNEDFYKKLVGAKLQPVLDTLKLMKKLNILIEVTTLVIPGENDSPEELAQIAGFIKNELGEETPWHISRFYPQYKLASHPPTSVSTLKKAYNIGREHGLRYVYLGNVQGDQAESTFCYNCEKLLIERYGYQILENNIESGSCKFCETKVDGLNM
ncbi:MAG: AmmeMemoRadiSam system radical SAM enzyme [Bacteroidales bacterium]|nr:AmmeMemoRadiSam system radical SAM enzyme [Bacteroidales bacterium]